MACYAGLHVVEVPVTMRARALGTASLTTLSPLQTAATQPAPTAPTSDPR